MKKLLVVGAPVVVAVIAVAGVYATPYWAVSSMRDAARAGDADRLAEYVDFPAVRASLKSTFQQRMSESAGQGALGGLGAQLAGSFVDGLVDTLVTPEGLAKLMQGASPGALEQAGSAAGVDTEMGYEGLSTFVAEVSGPGSDDPVVFVFSRSGVLSWELTGLRLPAVAAPGLGEMPGLPAR